MDLFMQDQLFIPKEGRRLGPQWAEVGRPGVAASRCALEAHNPDKKLWEDIKKLSDIEFDLNMEEIK